MRSLVSGVENLWNKYAASIQIIERKRQDTLGQLHEVFDGLGYLT